MPFSGFGNELAQASSFDQTISRQAAGTGDEK
jgi:hypothetical protein